MGTIWQSSLSRRELLKLGAVAWVAPRRWALGAAEPWSFAVFSDTHFGVVGNYDKNRVLLDQITRHSPDLAVLVGDVTERGWAEEYDEVDRALAGLGYRVHSAPGNHDVRWAPFGLQLFTERVGPANQVFEHRGCVFALLDTTVPLSHWGHLGGPQRRWLQRELERFDRNTPVFVFLHHAPGRTPAMLDDEDALGDVLAPFNTRVIFTGHGHSDLVWEWRGITCTMGRGLYQGSYQRVTVDPDAGEVRIQRQVAAAPEASPLATVQLARTATAVVASPAPAPVATGALALRWTRALGGGVLSHLLLHEGSLYLSAMDGNVLALDPANGNVRWQATTGGYCHSSPVLAGDLVIVGSADAHVYAFAAATGAERWRFATRGPVYASAAVARGIATIASGDGNVYGIDVASGKERWRFQLPPGPSAFAQSPAATDGERFFIGAWDRHVYALDAATGRQLWQYAATPTSFYYSAAIGAPAVVDGRLFVPSNDNTLHALDAVTGEALWTVKSSGDKYGYSSPTVVGNRLYIGCLGDRGEVRCLAVADGRELWVYATGATIYESSPAVTEGHVAIGSVNGTLWLLAAADGTLRGSFRFPPGHFTSSPAAERGRVYAATLSEMVAGLEVKAGG